MFLSVYMGDQFLGGWDQTTVFQLEEGVQRRVIHRGDRSGYCLRLGINQLITNDFSPGDMLAILVGEFAREIDLAARQFLGAFQGINAVEFHQGVGIALETVFLEEKRHEYAVDVEDEIKRWVYDNNPVLSRLYDSYDKLDYFRMDITAMDYYDLSPTPPEIKHFENL